jgi:hypothetical protein
VAAYALSLGYLCGLRGQVLLESFWARLLDILSGEMIFPESHRSEIPFFFPALFFRLLS